MWDIVLFLTKTSNMMDFIKDLVLGQGNCVNTAALAPRWADGGSTLLWTQHPLCLYSRWIVRRLIS